MASSAVAGNPNRRQLAGAEQGRQGRSVAAAGLDVVAGPRRNEGRRNHHTSMSQHRDLPMQAIAARPRFVAKSELAVLGGEALDHFGHRFRPAWNFADKPHLATPAALGHRHRDRVLVCIHCNEGCRRLVHGSFPMHEALTGSPANPRSCMPWNEPPITDIASQAPKLEPRIMV
jgi:hypothetical protein